MTWEGWLTLAVVALVIGAMGSGRASPAGALFLGLVVLMSTASITGTRVC